MFGVQVNVPHLGVWPHTTFDAACVTSCSTRWSCSQHGSGDARAALNKRIAVGFCTAQRRCRKASSAAGRFPQHVTNTQEACDNMTRRLCVCACPGAPSRQAQSWHGNPVRGRTSRLSWSSMSRGSPMRLAISSS